MTTATSPQAAASAILNHTAPTYTFRFTPFLRQTYQVGLPPDRPICRSFQTGTCPNGTRCPERHVSAPAVDATGKPHHQQGGLNSLVCKHWLRGLCKKGEHCEFLHEYNLRKMPECNFFMRNGYCSNGDECLYLHIDPLSRLPPCPHYDMGFCPLGPRCGKKHVRRKVCPYYLAGFCPDGPECKAGAHPKWRKDLERPRARSEEVEEERKREEARRERDGSDDGERGMDGGGRGGFGGRDRDGGGFEGRFGGGRGRGRWRGGRGRGGFRGRH